MPFTESFCPWLLLILRSGCKWPWKGAVESTTGQPEGLLLHEGHPEVETEADADGRKGRSNPEGCGQGCQTRQCIPWGVMLVRFYPAGAGHGFHLQWCQSLIGESVHVIDLMYGLILPRGTIHRDCICQSILTLFCCALLGVVYILQFLLLSEPCCAAYLLYSTKCKWCVSSEVAFVWQDAVYRGLLQVGKMWLQGKMWPTNVVLSWQSLTAAPQVGVFDMDVAIVCAVRHHKHETLKPSDGRSCKSWQENKGGWRHRTQGALSRWLAVWIRIPWWHISLADIEAYLHCCHRCA